MVDRSKLRDIEDEAAFGELAHFVFVEILGLETTVGLFEAIEIGGVVLLESADEGLHVELGAGLVLAEVSEADFNLVAELGGLLFGFGDAVFVAFGKLDLFLVASAAFGWPEKGAEGLGNPDPVDKTATFLAGFDFFDPFIGSFFVPIVGDRTSDDLNPKFFGGVGIELGERTSDTGKRVDLEIIEGFDWESFILDEAELGRVDNGVFVAAVDVVFVHFVNLDGRILGVNLTLNEALEDFGYPDVETDLAAGGNDFEAEVFLDAARVFEFFGVAQDAVEASKKLLGGELLFVVSARDFEHKENGVDIEDFEPVELLVIAIGKKTEDTDNRNPDVRLQNEMDKLRKHNNFIIAHCAKTR